MHNSAVETLYKYRTGTERDLEMLRRNSLYFCASHMFNDPFDCRARKEFEFANDDELIERFTPLEANHSDISVDQARARLTQIVASPMAKQAYLEEKSNLFQKLAMQGFGICCFSEVPDDILMWSHYSAGHKGFCLKFRRVENGFLHYTRPVTYPQDDEFPFIDYWLTNPKDQINEFKKVVLTKSRHWSYEKEWRALDRLERINEYYEGHELIYPQEDLVGIIFGLRMSDSQKENIQEALEHHKVEYFEARIRRNMFNIEICEFE